MAKKEKKEKDDDSLETPKKGKKLLIIILIVAVLLLGTGGYFGAAFFLQLWPFEVKGPTPEEVAAKLAQEEAEEAAKTKDMYIKFDKPFVFNMASNSKRPHTGQVEIVLVVSGADNESAAKTHLTLLNSVFFQALAEQNYEELLKPSGRQRLKRVLLDMSRAKMSEVAKAPLIEQVLFTSFVVQ
ncbi:MAG: flagellar basal body-associated FliL family protein [Succinivibrio sp.]|nr:flagellar basal body-associated FliL family protein [Succinivibrio sp.]